MGVRGREERGRDREKDETETERKNNFYICQDLGTPAFHSMSMNLSVSLNLMFSSESQILFCSVARLCLTLCNPMDCSMPGFPVFHHLPELALGNL